MLKLDPAQILWLKEEAPLKRQVELYVRSLGENGESGDGQFENNDGGGARVCSNAGGGVGGGSWDSWFENNGETWVQTLEWVLVERGEDGPAFWRELDEERMGIAIAHSYSDVISAVD